MRRLSWFGGAIRAGSVAACVVATPVLAADVEAIHQFKGVNHGGMDPQGALLQAADGELWGTTNAGGLHDDGTIFRISTEGQFESVASPPLGVARELVGDLVQTSDGTLYGVATSGGAFDGGSIYAVNGSQVSLVYSFDPNAWGGHPVGGLLLASDGKFYGVLPEAGNPQPLVYSFDPATLEWSPLAILPNTCNGYGSRLVEGADGYFYGVAAGPVASCVYRVNRKGTVKIVDDPRANVALGRLVVANDGSLYATKVLNSRCGSILRLSTSGDRTDLYHFPCYHGIKYGAPLPVLAQASDGTLHGSAYHHRIDGTAYYTAWSIATDGTGFTEVRMRYTTGLGTNTPIQASDGAFYATAPGGKFGNGTIVRITP